MAFYGTYKKSLESEKKIDIDAQIANLQKEGVMWNEVSTHKKNGRLFPGFLFGNLYSMLFAGQIFAESGRNIMGMSTAANAYVHFFVFSQIKYTKTNLRNESRLFALGHRTTVNVFGTRHY